MEQSTSPLVSIIMSVYNGETFLRECIKSVLDQTYKDFEFICINDGSKDSSLGILQEYAKKDSRLIIIDKVNSGLTKSLNIGINNAKGKFIARIDADDIWIQNKLELQINKFRNENKLHLLGTNFCLVNEDGEITLSDYNTIYDSKGLKKKLLFKNEFCHSSVMFVNDSKFRYNESVKFGQDYELWLRLKEYGDIQILPEVLVQRRISKDMISKKNRNGQFLQSLKTQVGHALRNRKNYIYIPYYYLHFLVFRFLFLVQDILRNDFHK